MGLHFIIGSSGSGKTYEVYQKAIKGSLEHPEWNYIVLVPEQFTLQTQKDLVEAHPRKGIMNLDVLSFLRLAYRVFEETKVPDRILLEDTSKSMVIKKVLLDKKTTLLRYGPSIHKPGFVDEMKSLISEFYQYSVDQKMQERMEKAAEGNELLLSKLRDIHTVYQGFQTFLKDRYITNEEVLDVLSESLLSSKKLKNSVVYLDGYTGFTPSQYKVLSSLLRQVKELYVTVTMEDSAAEKKVREHELFYMSYQTIQKLSKLAIEAKVSIEKEVISGIPYRFLGKEPLIFLEKEIYRYGKNQYTGSAKGLTLFAAKDVRQEVLFVVSKIKQLIRKEGYRYREIAVITGSMEHYGLWIRREFEQANIPFFLDENRNLLSNPTVIFLKSIVEMVEQDFSYDSVFRFLKSGLTGYSKELLDILENYVIALGIRGKSRWKKPFTYQYRTKRYIPLDEMNQLREQLMERLKTVVLVLSSKKSTVREFVVALYEVLESYAVEEQLKTWSVKWKLAEDPDRRLKAKEYEQAFPLVIALLDELVELLGEEVLPLREFSELLDTGFSKIKLRLLPPGVDQVVAGDVERTRLKDIQVLFLMGANEGLLPATKAGGGLLSDADRELFAKDGIELSPTKEQSAYTAEFYLYLSLTKPKNQLFLSYACLDGKKQLWPSSLISNVKALFPNLPVYREQELAKDIDFILGSDSGLSALIKGLLPEPKKLEEEVFTLLYQHYQEHHKDLFHRILKLTKKKQDETGLSKKTATSLYGTVLAGSVTRMEQYAACAFAHFISYGLQLEERVEYKLAMPDIGMLLHGAIELFGKKLKQAGILWHQLTTEKRELLALESIEEITKDYGFGILQSSNRNAYFITKLKRILFRTLQTLEFQIKEGSFEPYLYESPFFFNTESLSLSGRIDRLDCFEIEDELFMRVIDYKTGQANFDFGQFYYGLQMQLVLYQKAGKELLEKEFLKKDISPTGMLYYQVMDPFVSKLSNVEEELKKNLKMEGMVSEEARSLSIHDLQFVDEKGVLVPMHKSLVIPVSTTKSGGFSRFSKVVSKQDMRCLQEHMEYKLEQFSKEILEGNTTKNPYRFGNRTACDFCLYAAICGFDQRMKEYAYRNLKKLNKFEVLERIQHERKLDPGTTENYFVKKP